MGGGEQRMARRIMQQHQRPTAKRFPGAANQATGNQVAAIHRFLVPIHVEGGDRLVQVYYFRQPELRSPSGQCIRQCLGSPARATSERNRSTHQKP